MSLSVPVTPFEQVAARYIRHQRALGCRFDHQAWVIGTLSKFLATAGATDLDAAGFNAWSTAQQHTSGNSRRSAQLIVRRFCLYRRRTEPRCFVPDPLRFARRCAYAPPIIFGAAEVGRMIEAIAQMPPHPQFPLRRAVLRLAVILCYTAGLRSGELVRLTLADVDLRAGTLRIRESKFHKSRIVPLSLDAQRELRAYLKVRLAPPWDISVNAPLIGHHHGSSDFRPYSSALGQSLRQALDAAGIRDGQGRQPTMHDFRHSFAVQALLRWYRAGADVQAKLPLLAVYLGHVSIVSTAYYLHFIPDIARAASRRFEKNYGYLMQGGQL